MDKIQELLSQAKTAFATGQFEVAVVRCDNILKIESMNLEALILAGTGCLPWDKPEKAEGYLSKATEITPQNGELHFMLGNALFGQQRISEALQCYAKAERYGCSDESRKKLYYLMGIINQVQGQPKAALVNYKKSLNIPGINMDQVDIFLKCTQLYVETQNFDEAEDYAREIRLVKPDEFKSYELLFQILLQEQKIDDAFAVLDDAEVACPESNNVDIALYRTLLHSILAEIDNKNGIKHYTDALDILLLLDISTKLPTEKQLEIALAKAELYLKLEDVENGKKLAKEALNLEYSVESAEYLDKANFILLECLKLEEDLNIALTHAQALKKSKNGFYRCHGYYSIAWITQKVNGANEASKPYAEAIAFYRASTAQNPADMIAFSYRIRAYADIGEKGKAKELCFVLPKEMRAELEKYINETHS